jgi:hypothetical protein
MASLMTISKELRLAIAENVRVLEQTMAINDELTVFQVTSNEDKKNLCLACKALNLLVTPFLYKDMVIGTSRLTSDFAITLLPTHPGLPHVRTLHIRQGFNSLSHIFGISQARAAILDRLISTIPQHALTRFQ